MGCVKILFDFSNVNSQVKPKNFTLINQLMISISQFTDISKLSHSGRPKNFGKIYLDKQILPSIFQIIRNTKLSAQNRFFICQTNLFVKTFFSVALFCKITNLEENSLNKRSKIGAEISLVSRTENHFFHHHGPN